MIFKYVFYYKLHFQEEIFPTPIDGNNYIARLFAAEGFLVAGVDLKVWFSVA
jgi:hypothetical protein